MAPAQKCQSALLHLEEMLNRARYNLIHVCYSRNMWIFSESFSSHLWSGLGVSLAVYAGRESRSRRALTPWFPSSLTPGHTSDEWAYLTAWHLGCHGLRVSRWWSVVRGHHSRAVIEDHSWSMTMSMCEGGGGWGRWGGGEGCEGLHS